MVSETRTFTDLYVHSILSVFSIVQHVPLLPIPHTLNPLPLLDRHNFLFLVSWCKFFVDWGWGVCVNTKFTTYQLVNFVLTPTQGIQNLQNDTLLVLY